MSKIQALFDSYLLLIKEMRELEEAVVKQAEAIFAQSRAILTTKSRLDALIAEYHKILRVASPSVDQNKEFEKKLEEVTDIVVSKQKYKM